jgi:hypothetical protein
MTLVQQWMLYMIPVINGLVLWFVKMRVEHNIKVASKEYFLKLEQDFQEKMVSVQAGFTYKQLAIKASFNIVTQLNTLLYNSYRNFQRLAFFESMDAAQREGSYKAILETREFLFANQIFLDKEVFQEAIMSITMMVELSKFRAAKRKLPHEYKGKDIELEDTIFKRFSMAILLIQQKFELSASPSDLRPPERPTKEEIQLEKKK